MGRLILEIRWKIVSFLADWHVSRSTRHVAKTWEYIGKMKSINEEIKIRRKVKWDE